MTDLQKKQIFTLRSQGYGYATIAKAVGLKKDTIYSKKPPQSGTSDRRGIRRN